MGFAPLTEEQEAEKQEANDMKKQEMETRMAELNNGGDDNAERRRGRIMARVTQASIGVITIQGRDLPRGQ